MMKIRTGKDFWAGVMFLCFAAVGLYVARGYSLGKSGTMGPGYFPILLGIVLGLLGLLLVARAVTKGDEALSALSIRPLLFLVIAVVAFGVTIQPLGLILSLLLTLAIAALASRETRPLETSILAIGLAALSVGVFHYALQLPLPILPSFMTAG
ncbi:MAG TPA: tripartite tricarboxylate transporter TctB family protein [Pseudolabrys sp.]|jgi:hypothetical protein|nr:tripartite tricarboxylate transporter TctB family protein [Pseudolabrys sp.]